MWVLDISSSTLLKRYDFCMIFCSQLRDFNNPYNDYLGKTVSGSSLVFDSVGRGHIGTYLCIASNGVPPSVSKRVQLKVQCKYQTVLGSKLSHWFLHIFSANAVNKICKDF